MKWTTQQEQSDYYPSETYVKTLGEKINKNKHCTAYKKICKLKKHRTKVKMWESEKKLFCLNYRLVESKVSEFENPVSVEDIKNKEKISGAVTMENVVTLLEETKYHYLQYYIIFLKKIENVYPILYNYLGDIINKFVRKIDDAIDEWKSSKNDEVLLLKITKFFTTKNNTLRKVTDSGETVSVPSFTLVHLSLCILLLDYLLMNDELSLYNIKSIKPLKKIKNVMKEKPVHVPSELFKDKSVNKSKLQSYESYVSESKKMFDELKNNVRKMHDSTAFLIEEFEKTHKLLSEIEKLREVPQEIFDKDGWEKFKYENGIDYAKYVVSSILEYSVDDGSHLSELKNAFKNVLNELETLKISNTEASTVSELKESIKYEEEELKRLQIKETVSELSEYSASFFTVSQFPMNMKKLLEKYYKNQEGISYDYAQSIELVLQELDSTIDFCYSKRVNDDSDANACKEKLEKTLGLKLDKNIVLYPECKLKKCSVKNKRGKCFNGKRLVKCGKITENKEYKSIEDESGEISLLN